MRGMGILLAAVLTGPALASDVTDRETLDNLTRAIWQSGNECSRLVTAQRVDDGQFIVVCAGMTGFYRVAVSPTLRVTTGAWGR